jgi:hypothetical protein
MMLNSQKRDGRECYTNPLEKLELGGRKSERPAFKKHCHAAVCKE